MAKITVIADSIFVTSDVTKAQYDLAVKLSALADTLVDEETKDTMFQVAVREQGAAASKYGIVFNRTNEDGKLVCSFKDAKLPTDKVKAEAYVLDQYGACMLGLNKVEAQLIHAAEEAATRLGSLDITVVDA